MLKLFAHLNPILHLKIFSYRVIYKEDAYCCEDKKGHRDQQDPLMNKKVTHVPANQAGPLVGNRLWRVIAAELYKRSPEEKAQIAEMGQ